QVAYRVVAASAPDADETLWDSGRIESDQSTQVEYGGPALQSGQRIFWRVTVWDDAGTDVTSAVAWWEMGLLKRDDWQAEWVAAPLAGGAYTPNPAPYVRKEFGLRGDVATARLYITSVGLYEAWLNGKRVGEALLTPGWTDYTRRVQYQVYDVAELVRDGQNALGVILGDGWAVGHVAWAERQRYADRPRLLAQLVVRYSDGSSDTIASDGNWKVSTGGLLESDMLMGESFDARREPAGWNAPGFADDRWWPVEVVADTGAALVATNGPTIRRHEELAATILGDRREHQNRRWVFDLGQNMVGWVRLRVRGQAGRTIRLRYAEVLNPDGSLYLDNLRSARNVDYYTAAGDDEEVWEPRFTFHGFRYVEVFGLNGSATPDMLTGIVVHSDTPTSGMFTTSDPLINQLQHNIEWGQKGNFVDVPTDCPQRDERLGWTGDAQVFVRTAAFNKDVAAFFTKWAQDVEDAQAPNGAYPSVAPNPGVSNADGGPAWADAGIICPWTMYLCYGDRRILERFYPSMQRFAEFLHGTSRNGIRNYADYTGWHGYGDWLALDGSSTNFGGT
ncbi:MAG TPA: family 78 glycoside hydrolase catalytic domain, partial [Roseiflexaceae bacterium]|nr:family 78 glycoside hydrolase catalytic domain [Roseiflexaceae bacterium]